MKKNTKDILLVYIIFGIQRDQERQINSYITELEDLFWHLDQNKEVSARVAVAANLVSRICVDSLKNHFGDRITVYNFPERHTCQVVTNKVICTSIDHFDEEYEGYFYISSGLKFHRIKGWDLFKRIADKLHSKEHGILQMQADSDNGYHFLGKGTLGWFNDINFLEDYSIPLGNHANFHAGVIHRNLKDFYGIPVTDVHGKCGMESVLSYCCAALGMKYTLMGDSCLGHVRSSDAFAATNVGPGSKCVVEIPCHTQMFDRDKLEISRDPLAKEVGIGYYPGPLSNNEVDWNGIILEHDISKYDENGFALDERNKEVAKKYFFSNSTEIIYGNPSSEDATGHPILCNIDSF